MSSTLFDFNHHVLPGDVLLLRSAGLRALANRASQRAMRPLRPFRTAKFTHVAVVVSPTHIADAMPGAGVQVRSWRSAASNYDLERCKVARHPLLLALAYDPARLLARLQFYYAQRYGLKSLFNRTVEHDAGVVCSQLVVMVLHDLGLPALVPTAMRALPSDIDHRTRGSDGWRQFPFATYGWHPAVSRPPVDDPFWEVLVASLNGVALRVGSDERLCTAQEAVDAMMSSSTSALPSVEKAAIAMIGQPLTSMHRIESTEIALSEAVGTLMASSMAAAESVLRITSGLDRLGLAIAQALNSAPDSAKGERAFALGQALLEVMSGSPRLSDLSGNDLLDQLLAHYIDAADAVPKVLADADAAERRSQHRTLFEASISQLTRLSTERNDQVQAFQNQWELLIDLARKGCPITVELITSLHQLGMFLMNGVDWLSVDSVETILARTAGYAPLVSETLLPLLPQLGDEVAQRALDQVRALMQLDEQRLRWVSELKPSLKVQTEALATLLCESPGPDASSALA